MLWAGTGVSLTITDNIKRFRHLSEIYKEENNAEKINPTFYIINSKIQICVLCSLVHFHMECGKEPVLTQVTAIKGFT